MDSAEPLPNQDGLPFSSETSDVRFVIHEPVFPCDHAWANNEPGCETCLKKIRDVVEPLSDCESSMISQPRFILRLLRVLIQLMYLLNLNFTIINIYIKRLVMENLKFILDIL